MAEEHRLQEPRLCANNCGFFGSTATQNLCSKCFRDLQHQQQNSSSTKQVLNQTLAAAASAVSSPSGGGSAAASSSVSPSPPKPDQKTNPEKRVATEPEEEEKAPSQDPKRCLTCRRRVGITGFRCRCGFVFCGTHRYAEQHECSFDFKRMGKDKIAKANPIVKAEKLEKI